MKKRIFISIDLPQELRDYVYGVQRSLHFQEFADLHLVQKNQLHITLVFIGMLDEEKIQDICPVLELININAFELTLESRISIIPTIVHARILWISIIHKSLAFLIHTIIEHLQSLITIEKQHDDYQSHITLARIKKVYDSTMFAEYIKSIPIERLYFSVREFKLYESVFLPAGVEHREIMRFSLRKA